jgi:hypothetical protein
VFRIDPEFKKLIPALSAEEYMQLETNINEDGCRDPLTVWQEENLLLDGHNRFEICKRYGMEYELFFVFAHIVATPTKIGCLGRI